MEQCLYKLRHSKLAQQVQIKGAIADTEIALANLIRTTEQCEEKYTKTKKETK